MEDSLKDHCVKHTPLLFSSHNSSLHCVGSTLVDQEQAVLGLEYLCRRYAQWKAALGPFRRHLPFTSVFLIFTDVSIDRVFRLNILSVGPDARFMVWCAS